jgi:hypothetical protein
LPWAPEALTAKAILAPALSALWKLAFWISRTDPSRRILVYGEREGHEYSLLHDHPDGFRIDVDAELERVAAGLDGLPHGDAGVGGASHFHPLPVRFIDDRLLFLEGQGRAAIGRRLQVVGVNLYEIGSVLDLDPQLLAAFPWRVHQVKVSGAGGRSAQTFRRDDHPRAHDQAFIDGVAKVHVRRAAARQIPRRGKARLEVELRILGGEERDIGRGKRCSRHNDLRHHRVGTGAGAVTITPGGLSPSGRFATPAEKVTAMQHTPSFRSTSIVGVGVAEWHEDGKLGKIIRQLALVARTPTAEDTDTRPVLSRTAKLIISVIVFAFGMLAGAAIAAWIMPPS